jgi:NDP-sugar pyrophosphorylase family protein
LRPYTWVLPKPLMPIGEYPILEILIRQMVRCGFDHITLAVNHQAELIKAFFGFGDKWGIRIDYSLEREPLGTMGPLRLIEDLPEDFLVTNGDVLTDLDFGSFYERHVAERSIFTISSSVREHVNDYGVLEVSSEHQLTGFREKPVTRFEVSMGIYMVNRRAVDVIPEKRAYGFDHLMLDLIKHRYPVAVHTHSGYWLDIGRPDDYHVAVEKFDSAKAKFMP